MCLILTRTAINYTYKTFLYSIIENPLYFVYQIDNLAKPTRQILFNVFSFCLKVIFCV